MLYKMFLYFSHSWGATSTYLIKDVFFKTIVPAQVEIPTRYISLFMTTTVYLYGKSSNWKKQNFTDLVSRHEQHALLSPIVLKSYIGGIFLRNILSKIVRGLGPSVKMQSLLDKANRPFTDHPQELERRTVVRGRI